MARAVLVCVLTLGLGAASPASAQDPGDAANDAALRSYYSGNGFLNRGLYQLAADEYRQFLDRHGDHEKAPVARYGLAVSLFRLQDYEGARPHLVRLTEERSFEYAAEAVVILGQCQLALEDYDDAATSFDRLLRAPGDHHLADDAAALQAEALYRDGRYDDVDAPCRRLVDTWPDSPLRERAELFWGLSLMARGEHGDAADRFDAMLDRFPEGEYAGQVSLLLAQSLHRADDRDTAIDRYRQVIDDAVAAYLPDALYGLASLLHQQGDPRGAAPLLDRYLKDHSRHGLVESARLLRGRVWFDLGDYDRAFAQFEQVFRDGKNDVAEGAGVMTAAKEKGNKQSRDEAAYWMAKCELRNDQHDLAAQRLAQALQAFPKSDLRPEMIYDRSVALLRADRNDEALDSLAQFRSEFREHALGPDVLHLMATTHHQNGDYQSSREACTTFRQEFPRHDHSAAIAFLLAENDFLAGDYDEAAPAYQRFLEEHGDDPQADLARFRRGMALYHLDDFETARPLLMTVAEGSDTDEPFRVALLALGDGHFQAEELEEAETYLSAYVAFGGDLAAADDALLKLGLSRQRQGKTDEALEVYERLVDEHPDSPHRLQAVFERGQVLVALDRLDDAAGSFTEVLDLDDEGRFAVHAHNHLGSIAMRRDDPDAAARHFAEVAASGGGSDATSEALYQQAQALMASSSFDRAVEVLTTLLEEHGDSARVPEAAARRAIALARLGDHEAALEAAGQVEREHTGRLGVALRLAVLYEKAWCLRELNRHEDAAATYREILGTTPSGQLHLYSTLELAQLEAEAGRHDVAADLLRTLREQPGDGVPAEIREQALYRLGVAEFRIENHPVAASLLEEYIAAFPSSETLPSALLLCGESLFKTGRHRRAVGHLTKIGQDHRDDDAYGPSLLRLGECHAALQAWSDSEIAFRAFLKHDPDSPQWYQARFGIGWALENMGRHEAAMNAYQEVVATHRGPTAARAQFQTGECLYAMKRYSEAVRELLKVDIHYAYPTWSAAALYEAGRCFEELSNPVDARKQFLMVVEKHGDTKWAPLASQRLQALASTTLPGG